MFLSIVKDTDFNSNKYLSFVRWIVLNFSVQLKFADNLSAGNFSVNDSPFTAWKPYTGKASDIHYRYVCSVRRCLYQLIESDFRGHPFSMYAIFGHF